MGPVSETPSLKADNHDPVIGEILDKADKYNDDLDGLVDYTLEQIEFDAAKQKTSAQRYQDLYKWQEPDYLPLVSQGLTRPRQIYSYYRYNIKEQLEDKRKLLLEELWLKMPLLRSGSDANAITCRPNFGAPLASSVFGGEVLILTDSMLWQKEHLPKDQIVRIIDSFDRRKVRHGGLVAKAIEYTEYYKKKLGHKGIGIADFQNQSPLDIAHQVRGTDFFLDLYDDPSFVHALLEVCTEIYLEIVKLFDEAAEVTQREAVPYCDDSATLISQGHFEKFALPCLYKVSSKFSACDIHFCGKGHMLDYYLACPATRTINLGQPELYDYEDFMHRMIDARKFYSGLWPAWENEKTAEQYFRKILAGLRGRKQGLFLYIYGYEFGMRSEELAELWYDLQTEIFG